MKKYRLLDNDTIMFLGRKLFRIQALLSFGDVKEGDLGGYIEKEGNLAHREMPGSPAMLGSSAMRGSPAMHRSPAMPWYPTIQPSCV